MADRPMTDEDFERIEAALRRLAEAVGAADIMDARCYRDPIHEKADWVEEGRADRPLSIRWRLVAEMDALDRHLALLDRQTFEEALENIRGRLVQTLETSAAPSFPQTAEFTLDLAEGDGVLQFDLAGLPDLREARARLERLARWIGEA